MEHPIVVAPMAGGPTTPALVAAACEAGAFAFLAAGYRSAEDVAREIGEVRAATAHPFGVNLFVPTPDDADAAAVAAYAAGLRAEGLEPGEPRWSDDGWDAKVELVLRERPAAVSFTFGGPPRDVVSALRERGSRVWCTVTTPAEARTAADAGADGLVLQGAEAGGHRGSYDDTDDDPLPVLELLSRTRAAVAGTTLVAAGGIAEPEHVRAALAGGSAHVQAGTAFMLTPEAGTSAAHRAAFARDVGTALTRAFSGRRARGIVNGFMRDHDGAAPRGYPQVHYVTAPVRAAARAAGDAERINLWAGTSYRLARAEPAAAVVARLARAA
jgi:nitronate monooxygenase